mmetsp:Transcript_53553/g.100378  ORF Transcript_53553/g.100378 Transcript_53553/m.100378 type:complete len:309 (+) Transcript_53553:66-992(+)
MSFLPAGFFLETCSSCGCESGGHESIEALSQDEAKEDKDIQEQILKWLGNKVAQVKKVRNAEETKLAKQAADIAKGGRTQGGTTQKDKFMKDLRKFLVKKIVTTIKGYCPEEVWESCFGEVLEDKDVQKAIANLFENEETDKRGATKQDKAKEKDKKDKNLRSALKDAFLKVAKKGLNKEFKKLQDAIKKLGKAAVKELIHKLNHDQENDDQDDHGDAGPRQDDDDKDDGGHRSEHEDKHKKKDSRKDTPDYGDIGGQHGHFPHDGDQLADLINDRPYGINHDDVHDDVQEQLLEDAGADFQEDPAGD